MWVAQARLGSVRDRIKVSRANAARLLKLLEETKISFVHRANRAGAADFLDSHVHWHH